MSQQGLKASTRMLFSVGVGEKFVIRQDNRGPALTKLGHLQHELVPVLWPLTNKVKGKALFIGRAIV